MKNKNLTTLAVIGGLLLGLSAGCSRDVYLKPTENVIPVHQPGDSSLSCEELDLQIGDLERQAMALIPPKFAEDGGNQAAMFTGTFLFTPAYLYLLQNEMVDKPRQFERIQALVQRMELLQRYKAQKHCFENR